MCACDLSDGFGIVIPDQHGNMRLYCPQHAVEYMYEHQEEFRGKSAKALELLRLFEKMKQEKNKT